MQAPLAAHQLEQSLGMYRLSRMLHAAVELGVAPALADGPCDAAQVARRTGADGGTMRAFLDALACWGVFARDDDGHYSLTPFSRRLLPGEAGGVHPAMVTGWAGSDAVFDAYGGITHTLATAESGLVGRHGIDFHGFLARHPRQAERYNEAMVTTTESFELVAQAYDFAGSGCIVDIGGGHGAMLRTLLDKLPGTRGICFDLPHVIAGAPRPAHGRVEFVAGDAFAGVPSGADVYVSSTVLRCFRDDECLALLKNVAAAMTDAAARLVCFEYVLPPERNDLVLAMMDMTARVVYGGQDRTAMEFERLFDQAGLSLLESRPCSGALRALVVSRAR